ncbi:toll/interleukin-1 receptor domain-containing protein [Bradyrhizobium sp. BR 10289]|uniref:toll/interleukin-1 receptor domain-containing protein n=1 Tax=Bradyrhizobium sp. BR 10289 TaxID=2749993 RepID=UPI001C649859|nr:toll/interleukin-1 receptor domain-containing protein [Bradyrhizobium sp. BR 10289]MBW7968602.1 toll/interleukin-1 receptor domain-containing protein [Bradyrhizobium sp. BR 10289]
MAPGVGTELPTAGRAVSDGTEDTLPAMTGGCSVRNTASDRSMIPIQTRMAAELMARYRRMVQAKYPMRAAKWPLISGYDLRSGKMPGGMVLICDHTGNRNSFRGDVITQSLNPQQFGVASITLDNALALRAALERYLHLGPQDGLFIAVATEDSLVVVEAERQLAAVLERHEQYLGIAPMRVFLSHKGVDKEMVRRFEKVLREMGFDPWLDDDAMAAGAQPDRAIQKGFEDSCAAVFFVTPDFKDESWLASEIEYARAEKRKKAERFAIVTLCLSKNGVQGDVPELLKNYIYKKPAHELEALYEIVRALPVALGTPTFR